MDIFRYLRSDGSSAKIISYIHSIPDMEKHLLGRPDINGDTPLIYACEEAMDEVAMALLYTGYSNHTHITPAGRTALSCACLYTQEMGDFIKALIFTGDSIPGHISPDGLTPLLLLSETMEEESIKLLDTGRALPEHIGPDGNTALLLAARGNNRKLVQQLIDTGRSMPGHVNKAGDTALIEACRNGNDRIAQLLLETGESNIFHIDASNKDAYAYTLLYSMPDITAALRQPSVLNQMIQTAGPTRTAKDGTRYWEHDETGYLHRDDDRPAAIHTNGTREWYQDGMRHRIGGPAFITATNGGKWFNEGEKVPTIDPVQLMHLTLIQKSRPGEKKENFRFACMVYMGHGFINAYKTAHNIPDLRTKQTPIQLHIGSLAAPTEICIWAIDQFGELRRNLSAMSETFMAAKDRHITSAGVRDFFIDASQQAQIDSVGHVYGEEWLSRMDYVTQFPGDQMNWKWSHRYVEKSYDLSEERQKPDAQTGWFFMANNMGIPIGSKLLIPTYYMSFSTILEILERAGVHHLSMLDVSCAAVMYPGENIDFTDKWILQRLNKTAKQTNWSH